MKLRLGFVSNSSSCSFTLDKRFLSPMMIEMLFNPTKYLPDVIESLRSMAEENDEYVEQYDLFYWDSKDIEMWNIKETKNRIKFYADMNNFDYEQYARYIGIPDRAFIERGE